ncbi:hypothetical protein [Nesterenkonia pannonica]|uniref:hypothetical protein n=1 Tax=Nesterenkonia pannonica TaxID=1548602 RepID=UPI002164161E|nr:hypothetical protein [Nesterenkonia pannonica]
MTQTLKFAEAAALQDLSTYVARAKRIEQQGIRLQAAGSVVAAWVPVMTPSSLMGGCPPFSDCAPWRWARAPQPT